MSKLFTLKEIFRIDGISVLGPMVHKILSSLWCFYLDLVTVAFITYRSRYFVKAFLLFKTVSQLGIKYVNLFQERITVKTYILSHFLLASCQFSKNACIGILISQIHNHILHEYGIQLPWESRYAKPGLQRLKGSATSSILPHRHM